MNIPNLPEVSRLEEILVLGCIHRAYVMVIDACCLMSIVVILTMSSQCLCHVCWQGRLVAPRLINTALFIALDERSSRERFGASQ